MELGQAVVGDLLRGQGLGDHPDHVPARAEHGLRHDTHQPHPSPSVDEPDPAPGELLADVPGRLGVGRRDPRGGAAEDADGGTMIHGLLVGQVSQPDFLEAIRKWPGFFANP